MALAESGEYKMAKSEESQSVKETRTAALLAGTTAVAQAGGKSNESLKHGEESAGMLLALLNSPLETMIHSQQAKIAGTCFYLRNGVKVPTTIIFVFDTLPTENGTLKHAER